MSNIIGHIIGMDEIHKSIFQKQIPKSIKIVDLDHLQQCIYNHEKIAYQKKKWAQISNKINILRKQKSLLGSKSNIGHEIKKLLLERNNVRQKIHSIWREKMSQSIEDAMTSINGYYILFIGFNIFPKDYRVKVNIPLTVNNTNNNEYQNQIIFNIKSSDYASNQIRYYLEQYADRIVRGVFPLNLLKVDYLTNKYDKFTQHYFKQGYDIISKNSIVEHLQKLISQLSEIQKITGNVYVATLYRAIDIIPVNTKTPIQAFLTKEEAINDLKTKIKNITPIFIYEIKPEQFTLTNGKLFAVKDIHPINEESLLLTI